MTEEKQTQTEKLARDLRKKKIRKYVLIALALADGYRGQKGILHDRKYTEYARVVVTYGQLALDSAG